MFHLKVASTFEFPVVLAWFEAGEWRMAGLQPWKAIAEKTNLLTFACTKSRSLIPIPRDGFEREKVLQEAICEKGVQLRLARRILMRRPVETGPRRQIDECVIAALRSRSGSVARSLERYHPI